MVGHTGRFKGARVLRNLLAMCFDYARRKGLSAPNPLTQKSQDTVDVTHREQPIPCMAGLKKMLGPQLEATKSGSLKKTFCQKKCNICASLTRHTTCLKKNDHQPRAMLMTSFLADPFAAFKKIEEAKRWPGFV